MLSNKSTVVVFCVIWNFLHIHIAVYLFYHPPPFLLFLYPTEAIRNTKQILKSDSFIFHSPKTSCIRCTYTVIVHPWLILWTNCRESNLYFFNCRFQLRLYARVEVFKTEHKGWGLRAMKDIQPGQLIMEYCGEIIDPKEFKRR